MIKISLGWNFEIMDTNVWYSDVVSECEFNVDAERGNYSLGDGGEDLNKMVLKRILKFSLFFYPSCSQ